MRARRSHGWLVLLLLAGGALLLACHEPDDDTTAGAPYQDPEQPEDPEDPADPEDPDPLPERPPVSQGSSPLLDSAIFPAPGVREFVTANERELLSNGMDPQGWGGGYNGRAEMSDDMDGAAAEADPGQAPPAESEPEAVPDASREIIEADIFKVDGNYLYVLNRYRGLVVIDLSVPDEPQVAGRLPFQAVPVEMYLRDGRAYIVMSDYFTYWQYDPDADPHGFHGSRILIVDVSDPSNPLGMGHQLVEGEITDTRLVGDVLYSVSKRRPDYWRYNTADWEDRTWIVSLNIADPERIHEVDRVTFQGMSTLIHVAHHAVFVAAWDPNFYLTDFEHEQETLVTYVDISDPEGDLRERGSVYVPGHIQDKFKMHWHEGTFFTMSQRWGYRGEGWLHSVDTGFPDELRLLDSMEINDEDWGSLQASRYAGDRAYAMTTRYDYNRRTSINLLHVMDLSVPEALQHTATLQVDLRVTHFQVHGDLLLALGQQGDGSYNNNKVQLTVYDVADVDAPAVLDSVRLGLGSSSSVANGNYKALRVVPELEMILVPLSYYLRVDNHVTERFNGTQLVDWSGDQFTERGRISSQGRVERAFPVGDRLVAVSDQHIQVIDATDRDAPVETAAMYLVRTVYDIFDVQGREVQLVGPAFGTNLRFEVLPFGRRDDADALATLELPFRGTPACYRDGDVIHLIGWESNVHGQVVRNADFRSVLEPQLLGYLELTNEAESIYSGGISYYWRYWNPNAGLPLRNQILPFTVRQVRSGLGGRRYWESELRLVDLSDPANPRVADGVVSMNDFPFINKVTHGDILYSTHVEEAITHAGESLLYHVRAFVDRVDVSDPDNPVLLPTLNVPGWLVDASEDGSLLYTVDYQWDDYGRRRNSLNVLRVAGDSAELMEVLPVSDQVNRAVFRDRTLWLTTHKYPWWGVRGETVASRQPYTLLHRVQLNDAGSLAGYSSASLHGYHFNLLDIEDDQAYLASNGPYGLLVLDVADAADPEILTAARTIGYISKLVRHQDYLYMPLGAFGVHRMPVGAAAN